MKEQPPINQLDNIEHELEEFGRAVESTHPGLDLQEKRYSAFLSFAVGIEQPLTPDVEKELPTLARCKKNIEQATGSHYDTINEALTSFEHIYNPANIDAPINHDHSLKDFVADPKTPYDDIENSIIEGQFISHLTNTLTDQERAVIERRFGLNGHTPSILRTIAEELGIGRSRAGQIEKRALEKLKNNPHIRMLAKDRFEA